MAQAVAPKESSRDNRAGGVAEKNLVSAKVWNVYSLPPSTSVKGKVVPKVLQKYGRRRKLSVEVHRIPTSSKDGPDSNKKGHSGMPALFYDECFIRFWDPATKQVAEAAKKHAAEARRGGRLDASDNVDTGANQDEFEDFLNVGSIPTSETNGWKVKYQYPMRDLLLEAVRDNSVTISVAADMAKQSRELIFDDSHQAEQFAGFFETEKTMVKRRMDLKWQASTKGFGIKSDDKLELLIEIVSAWDLPDNLSSGPFVVCLINGKEVHRTKHVSKASDPIWTLRHGSLFLLTINSKELFTGDGLLCQIFDYDVVLGNLLVGCVSVPPGVLVDANGERKEFPLELPTGENGEVPGHLAIRCRRATPYDKKFMLEYAVPETEPSPLPDALMSDGGISNLRSIITKNTKLENGVKKYKVRPGPDPTRKAETEWLTEKDIEAECRKPSQHWTDSGSGKLATVHVEVLACDGLPNLDAGGFLGNKTDAFVSIVYEDALVRTDVVDDTLSPRWMPWTKRAFIFHIAHSSSQMFVGVFDYDVGLEDHDMIGKVSVDITNLRQNTVYTLKYDVFKSTNMSLRKSRGSITLRLRFEIHDDRKFILACLEPPPEIYVNAKTKKDFRVLRYCTSGKYDMEQYGMRVMNSYIEELLAYQHVMYYVEDAIIAVILWRGHFEVNILSKKMKLPIHSMIAFAFSTLVVERPQLIPSLFFFSIAWFLLAVMGYRYRSPDPWNRCKTFTEIAKTLLIGSPMEKPHRIRPMENFSESQALLESWKKRIEESDERAKKAYEESLEEQEELKEDMEQIGEVNTDISTKQVGVSIDIFKPIFFPIQKNLALICRSLRSVQAVVTWEESYFAFWITTISMILGFAFLFFPWFWLIKWSARITVWTVFGPWMKLADVFYYSKIQPLTEEEMEQQKNQERKERREATSVVVTEKRIKKENAIKLRDVKKFMFGNYIVRVPILKGDRFRDQPLPESVAMPYKPNRLPLAELAMLEAGYRRTRLPGQHLVGDMIPRIETAAFTDAPIGQATANPALLDRRSPGGGLRKRSESTAYVYAQLCSVIAAASIVTWIGVPILSAATEEILSWF